MNAAQPRFNSKFHPFNFARLVLFSHIFYFVFSSPDVFAATLPEYLGNIKAAKILIEDFADLDAAAFSNWEYLKIERETLTRTRAALPASERVEWQGGSIETNNQWLAEKLDRYQREPRVSARRAAILEEIVEQLDALERKVGELENAPAASRAKDEDKRKLAEILQREEYQKPEQASGNLLEKIYNRVVKWLAEMFPRANISPSSATNFHRFRLFCNWFFTL
jgi:hypothetical protein